MKLVLIGGNPKGFNVPFHPSTVSGKRLRSIVKELNIDCEIVNMTKNLNDVPSSEEIKQLAVKFQDREIVFLGRFVEKQLRSYFPNGVYLPHPASRRKVDLQRLKDGLKATNNGT